MIAGLLLLSLTGLTADQIDAIRFVQNMQTSSGGFVANLPANSPGAEPTLRTTRTGLRALRLLGGQVKNRDAVIRFLYQCHDPRSGGFSASPRLPPDPISTSVAMMIHNELGIPADDVLSPALEFMNRETRDFEQIRMVAPCLEEFDVSIQRAPEWSQLIDKIRNPDGSWGSGPGAARTTALHAMAAIRLKQEINREGVVRALLGGQRADGGFGNDRDENSDLESCYRVVRVLRRLDVVPERFDALKEFIARCRNDDGGFGRRPGEPSSLHGTYYATILRLWLDSEGWGFDEAKGGDLPSGWEVGSEQTVRGSDWKVVADTHTPNEKVLRQNSGSGRKRDFNLCISSLDYSDVEISAEVRPVSGRIDQGGGVVWRYQDARNYYIARWNPLEHNFRMYKVVDGVRSQLDTAQVAGESGEQHRVRIVCVGRDMRGYFDDQLLLEAEDDQFKGRGRIGVWTKADAVTEFDDVRSRYTEMFAVEEL